MNARGQPVFPATIPPMKPSDGASPLADSGLARWVLPLADRQFQLALAAAVPVWAALGHGVAGALYLPIGTTAWLVFVLGRPLVEEVAFRGLLQGRLLRRLAARRLAGITWANWLTTAAFAGLHALAQPPAWALAVVLPSLALGHLRERFGSVWPAVIVHIVYNGGFGVTAWWMQR